MFYKKKWLKKLVACMLTITTLFIALPTVSVPASADSASVLAQDPTITAAPFANGTYYISSAKIGNFVQVDNNVSVTTDGAKLEMWNFSGENVQKWKFTHLGNSCFKIENVASGKAIAVDSEKVTKDEAALIQKDYVNDPTMQWYVYQSGINYKITPMISDMVMAVGDGLGANGRNVEQRSYDTASNQYQWYIYDVTTYKYLNLATIAYYDPNCKLTETQLLNAYKEATAKMISNFNIAFQEPTFEMSADLSCSVACDSYGEPGVACTSECGSVNNCDSLHHKSAYKILGLTDTSGKYVCRFTYYNFCQYNADNVDHFTAEGVAYRNSKKCAVAAYQTEETVRQTIQHELTHNLGAYDNACSGRCTVNGDFDMWCSNCAALIRQNY